MVTRAGEGREISQDLMASVSFNFAVGCDLADGRPRICELLAKMIPGFFFGFSADAPQIYPSKVCDLVAFNIVRN